MSSRRRATRSQAQSPPSASQDPEFEPEEQGPSTYPSRTLDRPVIAPAVSHSEGASSTGPAPSQKRKLTIPNCSICKTPPKEPHAVYCCGAMYCHTCLVRAMSEAAKAGCQAACASCGKPMGDPPKKRRLLTSAAQATSALKQLRTEPTGIAGPTSLLSGPPIPGWSFSTAAETNSNILPFGHMSKPDNWIPSSRAEPLRIQHPSLPLSSGPNSMPSMSQLPSIEKYPIRSHEFAHSVATNPSEGSDRPPPGMYRPGGRMTEASGRNAQNQRIMAVIGDVDEMLPKLPDPYAAEEAKRIETQKKTELKIKQELQESQIVKGPSCATCWESSTDPVSMLCCSGIFCKLCLHNSLRYRKRCPLCNANFSHSATIANVSKLLIVQPRAKPVPQLTPLNGDFNVDLLTRNFDYLDEIHLSTMISRLQEIRERKYKAARQESLRTISVGLNDMVKKNKYDMEMLAAKTKAAIQDKQFLDGGFTRESALYGGVTSVMSSSSSSGSSIPTTEETILTPAQITKDERLRAHFDAFTNAYHEIYQKYSPYTNEDQTTMSLNRINAMSEVTEGITRYGNVTKIANLNYDCEPNPSMSIISSLEFDSTGERFVVAGVTKKIKIFDFNYFLNNPEKNHFPLGQLVCRSKISNISWSPDTRSLLASSDYDGHVSAWDIEKGKIVRTFQEHEKRCWTVHFSTVDPKIMASGSDDSKVLIWNVNCDRSVAKIEAKVNVCCVYFSPEKEHQLVFGSADHCVHLYDIRYTGKPLSIFKGHRKAVSYVRYLNKDTVVSASTDSSLRVWNVNDGRCTKVLKGHVNEKNFVGLSSNGDHVMCGSENSRAFFYYKGLSDPLCTYTVGKDNAPEDDTEGFVSSVCWKKDSDHVLVANSLGKVHLLELS